MINVAALFVSEHWQGFQSDMKCGIIVVLVGVTITVQSEFNFGQQYYDKRYIWFIINKQKKKIWKHIQKYLSCIYCKRNMSKL